MNIALRRPTMLEEFLAWEREQELRYEFDGIQPIATTGGTVAHTATSSNIERALDARLEDPCRVFQGDLKVVMENQVRYPDAIVTCQPIQDYVDVVPAPVAVFEVLSSSTRIVNERVKIVEYQTIASLMHYVMLKQNPAEAVIRSRTAADWDEARVVGLESTLDLAAPAGALPMGDLYRRVRVAG